MSPEHGETKPTSAGGPEASSGPGTRKPYTPPRLRSLGRVNEMTLIVVGSEARRKPHG
jgi:hypothetical protein